MEQTTIGTSAQAVVAILADDLIWASRLRAAVENAGAQAVTVRSATDVDQPLAVIDLSGRGYDGIEAVRTAASAGATVLAVGQHDDIEVRKAALAAGARRVLSYNKLFNDGPAVITRLIEGKL
jgi:DNA-binding NarL/FixJ family response regulator